MGNMQSSTPIPPHAFHRHPSFPVSLHPIHSSPPGRSIRSSRPSNPVHQHDNKHQHETRSPFGGIKSLIKSSQSPPPPPIHKPIASRPGIAASMIKLMLVQGGMPWGQNQKEPNVYRNRKQRRVRGSPGRQPRRGRRRISTCRTGPKEREEVGVNSNPAFPRSTWPRDR